MKIYCECRISKNGTHYWCLVGELKDGKDCILTFDRNVINRIFGGVTYREDLGYKEYYERG